MNNASRKIIEEMFFHYYGEPMISYYNTELLQDFIISPAEIVNIKLSSNTPEQFINNFIECSK